MAVRNKTIEEKYQAMDEIDHILKKSGMWVGSIKLETAQQFVYNYETATMENREVEFVPAMVKLVDEIISNSCDEFRRKDNLGLTEIDVTVDDNGWITVKYHEITDEEREEIGFSDDIAYCLDCKMPEDEEEILITRKWKGEYIVEHDMCIVDREYSLESGLEWTEVIAWQPLPAPYQTKGE